MTTNDQNAPDTTADAIRALCTAIQHIDPDTVDRNRAIADVANAVIGHAELLEDERDALERRVERLRAYSDELAWRATEAMRIWSTDADAAAEKHLLPGDLGDETGEGE